MAALLDSSKIILLAIGLEMKSKGMFHAHLMDVSGWVIGNGDIKQKVS